MWLASRSAGTAVLRRRSAAPQRPSPAPPRGPTGGALLPAAEGSASRHFQSQRPALRPSLGGGGCWATRGEGRPREARAGNPGAAAALAGHGGGALGRGGGLALDLAAGGPGRAPGAGLPLVHRTAGPALPGGGPAGWGAEPSADTVVLDPAGGPAVRVGARGGPRRSHHDAAALGGRWLCAVGGWDGARRLAAVAALDAERGEWEAWAAAPGSCPPAGLSSHTCTRLSDRELRVAGREGGTRTQRRYGSIYTLRLDPGARTYWEESYRSASRSGHCAALLPAPGPRPGHQLLLFGGCDSAEPEVAGHWRQGEIRVLLSPCLGWEAIPTVTLKPLQTEEPPVAPRLTEQLSKLVSSGQGSRQGPRGLRHHSCSVVGPFAVLFGGETLTRARDTICNDLYVYDTRRAPSPWFHFPCADRALKRVGHRTCLWNDQLYLVGGFGEDGRTASPQVCTLDLFL
ncbi:hypothetical protein QTO34_011759 [Cnephaeus nilssonii]|uniref:Kelch domain-containing protein 9 n=1 Tax=Cnephaeus nilssonii TaxID=3371016 RepID=A0AA40HE82_CNENI|nr:hypothetical protein QTO34_011759 [Eptesicus nilssonii]